MEKKEREQNDVTDLKDHHINSYYYHYHPRSYGTEVGPPFFSCKVESYDINQLKHTKKKFPQPFFLVNRLILSRGFKIK